MSNFSDDIHDDIQKAQELHAKILDFESEARRLHDAFKATPNTHLEKFLGELLGVVCIEYTLGGHHKQAWVASE